MTVDIDIVDIRVNMAVDIVDSRVDMTVDIDIVDIRVNMAVDIVDSRVDMTVYIVDIHLEAVHPGQLGVAPHYPAAVVVAQLARPHPGRGGHHLGRYI